MAALLSADEPPLGDALQVREVRTGCVGAGLPSHLVPPHLASAGPTGSPLLLGFHSGLRRNQATEAEITIPAGPLAGGTTMHVSRIASTSRPGMPRMSAARRAMYAAHGRAARGGAFRV